MLYYSPPNNPTCINMAVDGIVETALSLLSVNSAHWVGGKQSNSTNGLQPLCLSVMTGIQLHALNWLLSSMWSTIIMMIMTVYLHHKGKIFLITAIIGNERACYFVPKAWWEKKLMRSPLFAWPFCFCCCPPKLNNQLHHQRTFTAHYWW